MKILTVCLGNICRSPAAESVLIKEFSKAGINADVTSAGTSDYHIGSQAHKLTRKVGTERGYGFSSVAEQLTPTHLDEADVILAMDDSNLANILALTDTDEQRAKIVRFGAFASAVDQDGIANVPDPYGHPEDAFVSMYDQIEDAARGLVRAVEDQSLETVLQRYGAQ
ncbi:low molecular weight protein-tyrosine-phosphatase [Yaniella flava]|uniref:protein-tyrosine-phosphatase n=1 Tax=Yaniella flava TaxID=287930 RepID=A0ABP5GBY0_9MICC